MTKELISRKILEASDTGSYFVSNFTLMNMDQKDYQQLNIFMHDLCKENPDFTFFVCQDMLANGVRISWERNV